MNNLPFVVRNEYRYICKHCIGLLKKRISLKKKLEEHDEKLFNEYKGHCARRGLAVKSRNQGQAKAKAITFLWDR